MVHTLRVITEFGFLATHRPVLPLFLYIWCIIYKEHIDMHGTALLLLYSFLLHWYSEDSETERNEKGWKRRMNVYVFLYVCGYVPDIHKIYSFSSTLLFFYCKM